MESTWLDNNFVCEDLYAPFKLDRDVDYLGNLKKKYEIVKQQALKADADKESINIIVSFSKKILKSLNSYYKADIAESNQIILDLVKDIGDNPFAVSSVNNSEAFPGKKEDELQFFRSRLGYPNEHFKAIDMLHMPKSLRAKSGNYRFSIPGNPSMYLANSSYGCWLEMGCPADIEFNVSPILLDGSQKIFNLAISIRDDRFKKFSDEDSVHCWLKLYLLTIATSYIIEEENRTFKSEYIVSQSLMMACKKMKYDGIAYYSRRVEDELFSLCAINLVLFVDYNGKYSNLIKHIKIDDAFNYSLFKQLSGNFEYDTYNLRSIETNYITNIGNFGRQYAYRETWFCKFDRFLFYTWEKKSNGKGKNEISWGLEV